MHILVALFGEPISAKYSKVIENEVDVEGKITLKYRDFTATSEISKCREGENGIFVKCHGGVVESFTKPNEVSEASIITKEGTEKISGYSGAKRLVYQWQDFARIFAQNDKESMNMLLKNTRSVLKIIDSVRNV